MNAKNSSVLRITANICFYFTILCVFDAIRGMRLALAVFVALCFALGFVAVRCKNAWLRLLLGLLPALAFLLAELKFALVFPAAAAVYYAAVMCSGRFAVPLDEYRRSFSIQLALALFFIGANIVDTTLFKAKHVSPESLVFVVLFLLLGVYTMRTQQMGASMSGKWLASNLLTIVGFPTLAVGVSTALFLLLRFSEPVLSLVFRPLGTFLSWLMMKLFPSKVEEFVVPPTPGMLPAPATPYTPPNDREGDMEVFGNFDDEVFRSAVVDRMTLIGAYVVMAILFAIVLFLIVKHARGRLRYADEGEVVYEQTESAASDAGHGGRRPRRTAMHGNAGRIRRTYLLYLEYMKLHGLSIDESNTSGELLERSQKISHSPEAVRLRELYIAARYGDRSTITREQADEAQRCLDAITQGGSG